MLHEPSNDLAAIYNTLMYFEHHGSWQSSRTTFSEMNEPNIFTLSVLIQHMYRCASHRKDVYALSFICCIKFGLSLWMKNMEWRCLRLSSEEENMEKTNEMKQNKIFQSDTGRHKKNEKTGKKLKRKTVGRMERRLFIHWPTKNGNSARRRNVFDVLIQFWTKSIKS